MLIRPAHAGDAAAIWSIIGPTIRAGETYTLDPTMGEADGSLRLLIADGVGGERRRHHVLANALVREGRA